MSSILGLEALTLAISGANCFSFKISIEIHLNAVYSIFRMVCFDQTI